MSSAVMTPVLEESNVDSGDRLSFTLFLALVVHAILIFGVGFNLKQQSSQSQTLEITLASHRSAKAPDQADFIAQHNQEASGTEEKARQLTTERHAEFAAPEVRDVNPMPQTQAASPNERKDDQLISTIADSRQKMQVQTDPEPLDEQQQRDGLLQEQTFTTEIASLQAKLDRQRQEYAKRPRIRTLTSVSTKESFDAKYLHEWSVKVEEVGNKNYPQEALQRRITGQLRMSVVINPDGTIHEIEILQSSGQRIFDDAARQIVRLAAPFASFPTEIRQQADRLQIIRTWNFEITGLSTSAE